MHKGRISPSIKCERRSNPPRNRPTAVGLGKATDVSERTYSRKPRYGATHMRSYSDAKLLRIANLYKFFGKLIPKQD